MKQFLALFVILSVIAWPIFGFAEISKGTSLSSDNFKILDSQHSILGGVASSSSSNFILTATIGDLTIGSASASNFGLRSGFLYYPKVTAPTLNTVTAGDGQVELSWSAATAFQGWSIGGYNVCHKTTGSYTCVDSSSTSTSYTKTGLSNGTTYTFKVQAYDGLAAKNIIAESNEKTGTPELAATPTPTPSGGGGGGGGGGGFTQPAPTGTGTIILRGTAYPQSTVGIYLDGNLATSIQAGTSAKFEAQLASVAEGNRIVGISTKDANGRTSLTISFNVTITANTTTTLSDILIPPTIDISNYRPATGEVLRIFGQAAPLSQVDVHVASEHEIVTKAITDSNGAYTVRFNTTPLKGAEHITKSRAILEQIVSPFSKVVQFFLGGAAPSVRTADLNKDNRVNIIDFSILLFWWGTGQQNGLAVSDINKDGRVNIVDFSILLFQWTG